MCARRSQPSRGSQPNRTMSTSGAVPRPYLASWSQRPGGTSPRRHRIVPAPSSLAWSGMSSNNIPSPRPSTLSWITSIATVATRSSTTTAQEGGYLWDRLTVHYTPKHGSWLNQAEIELSLYWRQCLGKRRFPDVGTLRRETTAWNRTAHRKRTKINWRFTRRKARKVFRYTKPRRAE